MLGHRFLTPSLKMNESHSESWPQISPFTKWSKAKGSTVKNNNLLKQQQSNSHRQAVAEAEMCDQVEKRGSVFTQLHSASD